MPSLQILPLHGGIGSLPTLRWRLDPSSSMANYVLEILDGDRAGEVLDLSDQPLRIGRKPGNHLVLADEKVSGVHCEVVREGDRQVLRDLGSTNGTFLDGKRITELVLTPGDVVVIGRVRVKFRDAAAASGEPEIAVHRLSAARVPARGGARGLLLVLGLVVLLGGGFYATQAAGWLGGDPADPAGGSRKPVAPLQVAGNKLAAASACEGETGWQLRAAGVGFQPVGTSHSGQGSLQALPAAAADGPNFALATLLEPLTVLSGRTLTLSAHYRSGGTGQFALRAVCYSTSEQLPFRFRHGCPLRSSADWQTASATVTVPNGCDRLQVELLALLPAADAEVLVDDVAVVEQGEANACQLELPESNQQGIGTGAAFAVRSTDRDNPATLLAVEPGDVPAALTNLRNANLLALSDVGGTLAVSGDERSFSLQSQGVTALTLVFPSAAAADPQLQAQSGAPFASTAAQAQFSAVGLLLGSGATRALVSFANAVECNGVLAGGAYRLRVAANQLHLVLGFREQRLAAGELLRSARAGATPGEALDRLSELLARVPHDSAVLQEADQLRGELLAQQGDELAQLQRDLDDTKFFDTRGGFARAAQGAIELTLRYGAHHLRDAQAVQAVQAAASARIAELDRAASSSANATLQALGAAFAAQGQAELAKLVQGYAAQHFSTGGQ